METRRALPQGATDISILVRHFAAVRDITRKNEEKLLLVQGETVLEAINKLVVIHGDKLSSFLKGEDGKIRQGLTLLVNGESVLSTTQIRNGDTLVIMPPVGGGA